MIRISAPFNEHLCWRLPRCRPVETLQHRFYSSSVEESRVRRSLQYVPSSNPKMLEKSLSSQADTVIFDLEDSVAHKEKERARISLREFLKGTHMPQGEVAVRVNGITTPLFEADLQAVLPRATVKTLVLPKVHSAADLSHVSRSIQAIAPGKQVALVASIESAKALWDVGEIAGWKAFEGRARVVALLFAAEDYCADSSVMRTPERTELWYARSRIAAAAKAFNLQAIDMVCVDYKDTKVLEDEALEARRLGYDGKQAIHPLQVDIINKTFMPTEKEIRRAALILHGMEQSHASPKAAGAFGLQIGGRTEMIDAPMVKQAMKIVQVATQAGIKIPNVSHDTIDGS